MKLVLSHEQICRAVADYVEKNDLCPAGTTSVVVDLEATTAGWFSNVGIFEAHVTFKTNGKEIG